jgi:pimeloyl-ACP methyl ester carboxylesterase
VDLPGHGQSEMPQPFSLEQAATSLDEALAVRGGEPVVLVGHSLGGLVCAAEAIAHPDRVRALVLVETALRSQVPEADRPALLQRLDTHYAELVHGAYVDFGRDSAQGEALWRDVAGLDPEMIKRWIRLAWTSDLSVQAAELRVPVLVVLAPRSWDAAESWDHVSKALGYERVPHLHAERLDRCGHFVMLDRPRGLARLIAGFAANPWTEEPHAQLSAPSRPRAARSGS